VCRRTISICTAIDAIAFTCSGDRFRRRFVGNFCFWCSAACKRLGHFRLIKIFFIASARAWHANPTRTYCSSDTSYIIYCAGNSVMTSGSDLPRLYRSTTKNFTADHLANLWSHAEYRSRSYWRAFVAAWWPYRY